MNKKEKKFHRDLRPLEPNHWVQEHLSSTKHDVLHMIWTKEDVEENHDRTFSDEQWERIVECFNGCDFNDMEDNVTYIVNRILKERLT